MTDVIASTGPRLKAERERRGMSPQKAADELHLDGWVIDALEAEDYQRIGPSVYAKGHLKRYAELLGLPAGEIMAGYETRAQGSKSTPSAQPATVRLRADDRPVGNLPWAQIVGAVAALLLITGVIWWKPWHQREATSQNNASVAENPSAASTQGATDAADATAADTTVGAVVGTPSAPPMAAATPPSTTVTPSAAQTAAAEADAAAGTGHARLRLSFSADSWVDVHDAAGRRAYAGNGRANSVKTIAGIAPMRVYLGFASGVQLEINNHAVAIGPQFVAGDVARFEAGADGVLRRDSHLPPPVPTRNTRPSG